MASTITPPWGSKTFLIPRNYPENIYYTENLTETNHKGVISEDGGNGWEQYEQASARARMFGEVDDEEPIYVRDERAGGSEYAVLRLENIDRLLEGIKEPGGALEDLKEWFRVHF